MRRRGARVGAWCRASGLGTGSLVAAVHAARVKPRVFVHACAIGIYGAHANGDTFDESSPAGSDFLAKLCVTWEAAASPIAAEGCRLIIVRNAVVLSRPHPDVYRELI